MQQSSNLLTFLPSVQFPVYILNLALLMDDEFTKLNWSGPINSSFQKIWFSTNEMSFVIFNKNSTQVGLTDVKPARRAGWAGWAGWADWAG